MGMITITISDILLIVLLWLIVMWVKQCHKPPMTGNGQHTTYWNGDDWGDGLRHGFTHIIVPTWGF